MSDAPSPILVVHGISNRDPKTFEATVATLQSNLGVRFRLIDVYWGDLGGRSAGLTDALPDVFPSTSIDTRESVPANYAVEVILAGILGRPDGYAVRSGGDDDILECLEEAVQASTYVKALDDIEALTAIGRIVQAALEAGESPAGFYEVRGSSIAKLVKAVVHQVDLLIGNVTNGIGGTINQFVRSRLAVPISLTLGDVVAYHQNRRQIHQRLFQRIDELAPNCGSEDAPIGVMAHSLGGLLVIDAALGAELDRRLWIDRLVTFGSQPAFFHVMAPRKGIEQYTLGKPVVLPETIRSWTNLWHQLDVLAFAASKVFRVHDGSTPKDVRVDTMGTEIIENSGWLHSVYWNSPQLVAAWR